MKIIYNYIGTYTIFHTLNSDGTQSSNLDDNYLKGKANSQVYRYSYPIHTDLSKNVLSLYLPSGTSTSNIVIPKIQGLGVNIELFIDCSEHVWHFKESDIHKVNEVMNFYTKGCLQQLKNKTREDKLKAKEEKLRLKEENDKLKIVKKNRKNSLHK